MQTFNTTCDPVTVVTMIYISVKGHALKRHQEDQTVGRLGLGFHLPFLRGRPYGRKQRNLFLFTFNQTIDGVTKA